MKFEKKLIGDEDERAVSPVIGVILMVAITVILAAVIAAFVLDLGQSQSAGPAAGIQFDESGSDVVVTYIQDTRTDGSDVVVNQKDATGSGTACDTDTLSVGETTTCEAGHSITVTATYDGSDGVVGNYNP